MKKNLLLALSLLLLPLAVQAADELYDLGLELGVGIPNNGLSMHPTFGVTVGMRVMPFLRAGLFVNYLSLGEISSSSLTINNSGQSLTFFGAEADLNMNTLSPYLNIGAKIGLARSAISSSAPSIFVGDVSTTNLLAGPKVSFDYPFLDRFSLGGEASLLFKSSSDEPIAGYQTVYGMTSLWNLMAVGKIHF